MDISLLRDLATDGGFSEVVADHLTASDFLAMLEALEAIYARCDSNATDWDARRFAKRVSAEALDTIGGD